MALMFFPDRPAALAEMRRVVTAGGNVAAIVPGRLDVQPAFAPFLEWPLGTPALRLCRSSAPTSCAATSTSSRRCSPPSGLEVTVARTHVGTYRADSIDAAVTTEVESTPLRERISDEVYARIRHDAREALAPFTTADGRLASPFECNIVVARRH